MADSVINTLSLCSGYAGLDLGLEAACGYLGIESRTVAYVEWEASAAALLIARMEAGQLAAAPVWCGDLGKLSGADFRGAVDCVTAGFPCQPHSQSGARKGINDERWIWPAIARIIRESGAWLVVLENVPGLLSSGGFGPVLMDLAEMGFDAEWGVLSAAAVGASHRRERVFIVGYSRLQQQHIQQRNDGAKHQAADGGVANANRAEGRRYGAGAGARQRNVVTGPSSDVADADSDVKRRHDRSRCFQGETDPVKATECREDGERLRDGLSDGMQDLAVTNSSNRERRWQRGDARGRQEPDGYAGLESRELFAPSPNAPEWGEIIAAYPHLAPAIESGVRVLADGHPVVVDQYQAHQLRLGGNGVVPLQAAAAIVELGRRLGVFNARRPS